MRGATPPLPHVMVPSQEQGQAYLYFYTEMSTKLHMTFRVHKEQYQ
jgi:hypothetical protein